MDNLTRFRKAIIEVLEDYKNQFRQSSYELQPHILTDDSNHHFQFLWMGWKDNRQIFNSPIHIEIKGDKIWVQKDNTESGVANLLVEKGIPKSNIVLAYFSPEHRKLTEFSVG